MSRGNTPPSTISISATKMQEGFTESEGKNFNTTINLRGRDIVVSTGNRDPRELVGRKGRKGHQFNLVPEISVDGKPYYRMQ